MEKLKRVWSKFKATKFARFIKNYFGLDDAIALFFGLVGVLFYVKGPIPYHEGLHNFYDRIHIDLMILAATVLIIGNANQYIQRQAEKRNLIIQMGGSDNGIARGAVRQLRIRGWLTDGSLKGADLQRAHLEGADLGEAHLEGTDLGEAHLEGADLWKAHLERAHLCGAHLEGADLRKAHLEGAYLGWAYLEGANLGKAHLEGANLRWTTYNDETEWVKTFYTTGENGTMWPVKDFDPEAKGCILVEA